MAAIANTLASAGAEVSQLSNMHLPPLPTESLPGMAPVPVKNTQASARRVISRTPHAPSPVFALPVEITAQIFIDCLVELAEPDPLSAPLLLGNICSHWRHVALSTPRLWSSFNKTLPQDSPRTPFLLELLQIWLSRSGLHPLTLSFRYAEIRIRPTPDPFHRIILQHAHQWQDVGFHLPHADLAQLFDEFAGTFPLLKSLTIASQDAETTAALSFASLRSSPFLRILRTCGDLLRPMPSSIPWSGLTRFHVCDFTPTQAHELFRLAPSLQECTLRITERGDFVGSSLPPLLELRVLDMSTRLSLLPCLTLPALQRLSSVSLDDDTDVSEFLSFLTRSGCALTHLHLFAMGLDESRFIDLCTTLPNLVDLGLWTFASPHSNPIVLLLHGRNRYLPCLTALELNTHVLVNYELLADMLESRSGIDADGVAQLQSFRLNLLPWIQKIQRPEPRTLDRFKKLMERGMRIMSSGMGGPLFE
ncbi:hypothetical protein B0H17DRAFT_681022 [Mycena rosella]|uniref:F-box domain-containing protein n=1 Tax=Mycena rosella TaxID=1033263 RepID=A0AAD7BAG4_MYCRO|nr:hypothetical protein B0H17DRAFT_681022 [Mycena rosella]